MKNGSALQAATKWIGLVASVCTLALGILHMIDIEPRIRWPSNEGFLHDDHNANYWRGRMFSFAPSVFVDVWTPFMFGLAGILAHIPQSGTVFTFITSNFLTYALFNLVVAFFANLAYNGGVGIIFSCLSFLACLLGLIVSYTDEDRASLELEIKVASAH